MTLSNKKDHRYMFFYGTLMGSVPFELGDFHTKEPFIMSGIKAGFPRTSHPDQYPDLPYGFIKGKLHEIPENNYPKIKRELDYYEGYPDFYQCIQTIVENENGETYLTDMYFSNSAQDIFDYGGKSICCIPDQNGMISWREF